MENGDIKVLVTALKQHMEKICKDTFLDGNGENPVLPEWVIVAKSQMMETLSTNTEAWWNDFIGYRGRVTTNNTTTTGIIDLCFVVKTTVNDINEIVKGFLIAAEEKERDQPVKTLLTAIK